MEEQTNKLINQVAEKGLGLIPNTIKPMIGDASLRRYYRLNYSTNLAGQSTFVAMVWDSVNPPESGSGPQIAGDDSYHELSLLFERNGIMVPKFFVDGRGLFTGEPKSIFLIEDCGDKILADLTTSDQIKNYLEEAVGEIIKISSVPVTEFPYKRGFTSDLYFAETREFEQYILEKLSPTFDLFCTTLSELLALESRVVVHRDFHGWNLMVDQNNKIRVIDFQDALLGHPMYDLVSLLNDRGFDTMIGEKLHHSLIDLFSKEMKIHNGHELFKLMSLQRDMKAAGRFAKLVKLRGLNKYGEWIPGTIKRLKKNIEDLSIFDSHIQKIFSELEY